jgi:dTMP kinase
MLGLTGRIIALEGIDQSGKRTQTRLLTNHLNRIGLKTGTISFPIYGSPAGQQIRRFLDDKRDYSSRALHMLYSLNRWENLCKLQEILGKVSYLVADRYSPSNLAYGVSRGLPPDWLESLDRGLPRSDLVIVLDVPVGFSFHRKSTKRDIHESDKRLLARARQVYKVLARKLDWTMVDGTRDVGEVESAIWNIVRRKFHLTRYELQPTRLNL